MSLLVSRFIVKTSRSRHSNVGKLRRFSMCVAVSQRWRPNGWRAAVLVCHFDAFWSRLDDACIYAMARGGLSSYCRKKKMKKKKATHKEGARSKKKKEKKNKEVVPRVQWGLGTFSNFLNYTFYANYSQIPKMIQN